MNPYLLHSVQSTLALLPFIAYAVIFWIFRLHGERLRSAAIGAATCWAAVLTLMTEILSVPHWIARPALAGAWIAVIISLSVYIWLLRRRSQQSEAPSIAIPDLSSLEKSFLIAISLILILVAVTAVISPPNTMDAMSYHMNRIVQWENNRDINFYPTFFSAQLFLQPWAEYAMLHLDLLYGGDRLVNLIEWLSFMGAIVGVSLIAERLGAGWRGQMFAAIACATIPQAILEASGAMNTCVGGFWIVVTVYYLLRWNTEQSWGVIMASGIAFGLAIFTKGTAYIFLPFICLACWWLGSPMARKRLLMRLPALLLLVLALNGPLYVRNYALSGSPLGFSTPLGNDPERQYSNSRYSIPITFANVVKNLALHISAPPGLNSASRNIIAHGLRSIGIDPNDKDSTYRTGFYLTGLSLHENNAGNPLQVLLIAGATILVFSRRTGLPHVKLYLSAIVAAFILFCALLRWQPWNSRYHLPLFMLGTAAVGTVLERRWPRALEIAASGLLLFACPFVVFNSIRPLLPTPWKPATIFQKSRAEMYFADGLGFNRDPDIFAANLLLSTPCRNIGVDSSLHGFEYPLFVLLRNDSAGEQIRIHYAGVRNLTASYSRREDQQPCAVVCISCAHAPTKWGQYQSVGGRVSILEEVAIFSPYGELSNNETLRVPANFEPGPLIRELDRCREPLYAKEFSSATEKATQAWHEWPTKRTDLDLRLKAIEIYNLGLWGVRDSVDPIYKKGESPNEAKIDPVQLEAALQVLENAERITPIKIQEVEDLVNQLNSSWTERLIEFQPANVEAASIGCRARIRIDESRLRGTENSREQTVSGPYCECLAQHDHPGDILARKPAGKYDSEAEQLTVCRVPLEKHTVGPVALAPAAERMPVVAR